MRHFVGLTLAGVVSIGFGVLYLFKPNIFRRGIWKQTSIAQITMTPEAYEKYMRKTGKVYIGIGIALIFCGLVALSNA